MTEKLLVTVISFVLLFMSPHFIDAANVSHNILIKQLPPISTNGTNTAKITLKSGDIKDKVLKFYIITFPSHGSLSGKVPNLTYTSNFGYVGNDNFTYSVSNKTIESNIATVFIKVNLLPVYIVDIILFFIFAIAFGILFAINNKNSGDYTYNKNEDCWSKASEEKELLNKYINKIEGAYNKRVTQSVVNSSGQSLNTSEIMKKEYDRYSDLFKENENLGERRVNFYITLITTIITALGITSIVSNISSFPFQFAKSTILLYTTFFILSGLFLFGLVTFRRIIHRNVVTDDYKVELDIVRIGFKIKPLKPVASRRGLKKAFLLGNGGIAETVKLLNSLIVGLICSVISLIFTFEVNPLILIPFSIGIVGAWFNQSIYSNYSYIEDEKRRIRGIKK
jgi:hypothetical protein